MKLKELKTGDIGTVECVILSIEEKNNRNNGVFLNITVSDGNTQVTGKKWNTKREEFPFPAGQTVFVEMKAEDYKGICSYIIRDVMESTSDPQNFVCGAPIKSEDMLRFLIHNAERCGVYAPVVKKILEDNKDKLLYWGAAHSMHHNIYGGLLYHTYRMVNQAAYIANVYNKTPGMIPGVRVINTELLVAGTILHDIGKIWELETSTLGASEYTPKGTLLGHIFIGAEVFGKYAREANLKDEDIMLMQHLILSHHGKREYGAAAIPAIPEAMILHHIDMMDSYIYQFETIGDSIEPGLTSDYSVGLDQKVYRPTWRVPENKNK